MGRITAPFAYVFGADLETIKAFRDKLKDGDLRVACDAVIRACTAEQGAIKNSNIADTMSAILLATSVEERREIEALEKRLNSLELIITELDNWSQQRRGDLP